MGDGNDDDEDPLASLAAAQRRRREKGGRGGAALAVEAVGARGNGIASGGRGGGPSKQRLSQQGYHHRVRESALPAEHPAFALAQRNLALKGRSSSHTAAGGGGGDRPAVDKRSITLLVTEHADRLREVMTKLAENANKQGGGNVFNGGMVYKQAISDAMV